MEQLTVPWLDRPISRLAFGCAAIGGYDYGPVYDANSVAAVHRALDLGFNVFDTADVYGLGRSEEVLGRALDDAGARARVAIATKGGVRWTSDGKTTRTLDPGYLVSALDASLTRLRTDRVELYQLHWPVAGADFDGIMDALVRCRDAGKIGAIGCSNFTPLGAAALARRGPLAAEQVSFNLIDRDAEPAMRAAVAAGRTTFTYNSLAQGLFSGRHRAGAVFEGNDLRARGGYFASPRAPAYLETVDRLQRLADARGRSILQLALRWALDQPFVGVAIAGIKHAWQADEIAGAVGWLLSPEEHRAIREAAVDVAGPHAPVVDTPSLRI